MAPEPDRRRDHVGTRRPDPRICLGCELASACPMLFPRCLGNQPASRFGPASEGKVERRASVPSTPTRAQSGLEPSGPGRPG